VTPSATEFPVLAIASNGHVSSVANDVALETCSRSAIRIGYYNLLILVDVAGRVFRVTGVEERTSPVWKRLFSRHTSVKLLLEPAERLTLDQVQDLGCDAMSRLPDQWEGTEDVEDAQDRVRKTRSSRELHELFL